MNTLRSFLIDMATGCGFLLIAGGLHWLTAFAPLLTDLALWVSATFSLGLSLAAFAMGLFDLRKAVKGGAE